jgi:hypothetical protein
MPEGPIPNLNEAFTQLHLGQLLAIVKCTSGDGRDGRIDPNTDHINWGTIPSFPRVVKDFVIIII